MKCPFNISNPWSEYNIYIICRIVGPWYIGCFTSFGKYVVSTNVGGIEDVLHPECGLLSEITDKTSFFDNLFRACAQKEQLQKSSEKGEKWALTKFSYVRLVDDMRQLYTQLLKRAWFLILRDKF